MPLLVIATILLLTSCGGQGAGEIIVIGDETFISDKQGERWNISHAVQKYRMDPSKFFYGIGRNAIPSEDSPTVLKEDQLGYPASNSRTGVFGVTVGNAPRAYNVGAMSRHEIFNDEIDGEPYIVAY